MTLEQQRAGLAFEQIKDLSNRREEEAKRDYAPMAQKLPILIRSAGLCQALHFVRSRHKRPVLAELLDHLAAQLRRTDPTIADGAGLCERARQAGLTDYLWMTREALACAEWYARLSQSELGVERGAGEP
jgi:CRISPR-associated protein Cmr5